MDEKNNNISNNENSNDINLDKTEEQILDEFSDIIDGPDKEYFRLAVGVDNKWYPSDACLKENIEENMCGLKEINSLQVKSYTYKADKNSTIHVGVIAQELQKIFPNSVIRNKEGYLLINTEEMFFAMINAIKELSSEVDNLKSEIINLKK